MAHSPSSTRTVDGAAASCSVTELAEVLDILHGLRDEVHELREQITGRIKPYYTVEEVAELVGRSPYTIRRWVAEDRIAAIRVESSGPRGRLLVPRDQLDKLLEAGHGEKIPAAALAINSTK